MRSPRRKTHNRRTRFVPAGEIKSAEIISHPPFISEIARTTRKRKGKRGEGNRYERRAQQYLVERYGVEYLKSPWFRFRSYDRPEWRYCQPDGLLFDLEAGKITIVEIKLKHTIQAWWQVRHLYEPVLEFLFPQTLWKFTACEVVRWFDPSTDFPEQLTPTGAIERLIPGAFGLHIWNPYRWQH